MGSVVGRSAGFLSRAASCLAALGAAAAVLLGASPAQAQDCITATHEFVSAFEPGEQNFQVKVTISSTCAGEVYALGLRDQLPPGWSFGSIIGQGTNIPDWNTQNPAPGGLLEFAWIDVPSFPFSFTYTVNVPATESGDRSINGTVLYRVLAGTQQTATFSNIARLSIPPTLELLGGDVVLNCGDEYEEPGYTAIDVVDGDISADVEVSHNIDNKKAGVYTVIYTVVNSLNKGASTTRRVEVVDIEPPTLTLLGERNITIECGTNFVDPGATGFDECQGAVTPQVTSELNTRVPGIYTISYVARDAGGNTSPTQTRTVTVLDTRPPVITLVGANPLVVQCGSPLSDPGATAADTCHGDLTGAIVANRRNVNTAVVGDYTITYDVTDPDNNTATRVTRTVQVRDTAKPTITLLGNSSVVIQCGTNFQAEDPGATAFDACKGSLTVTRDYSQLNTNVAGTQRVTYSANDGTNGVVSIVRTVNVVDFTAPTLTLIGNSTTEVDCGETYTELGATAEDNCDVNLNVVIGGDTVDTSRPGTYRVDYSVQDARGNKKEASRLVVVRDSTAPVLTLVGESEVTVQCSQPYAELGATAIDACNGDLSATVVIGGDRVNISQPGTYNVTYNVKDSNGNAAAELVRTVRVVDTTRPVIQVQGGDETLACGEEYIDAGAIARDDCGGDLTSAIQVTGADIDTDVPGQYTVTYTVRDASNNSATATRTVTVVELGCGEEGEGEGVEEGEGEGSAELPECDPETVELIAPAANAIIPFGQSSAEVTLQATVGYTADPPCDLPARTTVLYSVDGVLVGSSTDRAGGYPFTISLGVGEYVLAATAVPQDQSKAVSTVKEFSVIVAVDNDDNGILDNPFINMPGNGDRWSSQVATAEGCKRAVASQAFTLDGADDVIVEVANPVNPDQKVEVRAKRGVLLEGEKGVLIVHIACNLPSLYYPYNANGVQAQLPSGTIAGLPFIDVAIIASSDNGASFRQIETVEVDGAPAVTVDFRASALVRGATFRAHDSIVDGAVYGLALQPGGGVWARNGVENVVSTTGRLRAQLRHLSTLGVFVAVDLPAELSADRESLDFGEVEAGESAERTLSVMNGGDAPVSANVSVSGNGFTLVGEGNLNIPAGGTVSVTVRFEPERAGLYAGSLDINAGEGGTLQIPLAGFGLQAGKTSNTGCGINPASDGGFTADLLVVLAVLAMLSAAAWKRRAV
jgi:hypothetical protein